MILSSHNSIQRKNRRIRYSCKKRNLLYKHICMNYHLKYLINESKSNKITWCYRCTSEIFPLFTYQCSAGVASSPLAQREGCHWNVWLHQPPFPAWEWTPGRRTGSDVYLQTEIKSTIFLPNYELNIDLKVLVIVFFLRS